ncbi:hypothetical protein [Spirosoma areae]
MSIKTVFLSVALSVLPFLSASAQTTTTANDSLKTVAGKWAGTFEGASSGKFELVLNQDSHQKLTGQVIMLPDDGNRYPISLKTVVWQKGQLSATYTDPSDGDEVSFTGNYTSPMLKGTWKADGGQSTGTWQVTPSK